VVLFCLLHETKDRINFKKNNSKKSRNCEKPKQIAHGITVKQHVPLNYPLSPLHNITGLFLTIINFTLSENEEIWSLSVKEKKNVEAVVSKTITGCYIEELTPELQNTQRVHTSACCILSGSHIPRQNYFW